MATEILDGIETHYEVTGSGPPLLLFSPGGFNATIENWSSFGIYRRLNLLEHLQRRYTCIAFDKRESGASGGRIEQIGWDDYATQGAALLDHLQIDRAHVLGGCVGCSIVCALAVAHPERIASMVLYSPAGGPRYRMMQLARFAEHLAFTAEEGLLGVVKLAASHEQTFAQDPRVGPWVSVLRRDPAFAGVYVHQREDQYSEIVDAMGRGLFDRDAVPGAEPKQLMELDIRALVVPGHDASHATSAARYLEECLERSEYWDVPVEAQTEETAPARVLGFLSGGGSEQ